MDAELKRYVKRALRKGHSEERVKRQLLQKGWEEDEIDAAIRSAKRSGGSIILAGLLLVILGVAGGATWMFLDTGDSLPGDQENLTGPPDNDTNTSSQPPSNTTENKTRDVISECQLRDGSDAKYQCYYNTLQEDITAVYCNDLPEGDRYLCNKAYEQLVTA